MPRTHRSSHLPVVIILLLAALPQVVIAIQPDDVSRTEYSVPQGVALDVTANQQRQFDHLAHANKIEMRATTGEAVIFEYEIISAPDDGLFYLPGRVAIGPSGRQYHLDTGDNDIKVLSAQNEHLHSFGGRGQAPGEWLDAQFLTVAPSGHVYVWDNDQNIFHVFDAEGSFIHRVYLPGQKLTIGSVVWVNDTEFFVSGASMDPGYYRYAVHRLKVEPSAEADQLVLTRLASFVEMPAYEPGLYQLLAKGLLARDIDETLIFSASTTHRVEKYTTDGTLVWSLHDPEVLPNAAERLSVTPTGRVQLQRVAQAAALLATRDWIVHEVLLEAEGVPPRPEGGGFVEPGSVDVGAVVVRKVFELIDRRDPQGARLVVPTTADLIVHTVDGEGRIYGLINYFVEPTPVRGRLLVDHQR